MFWRGILGYLPVNIAQGVVGLLTIVLFTRVLSPEEYGGYALAFSALSLTQTLLLTWSEAAMARFFAARSEDGRLPDHFATLYRLWFGCALVIPVIAGVVLFLLPLAAPMKVALAAAFASASIKSLTKLSQERRRAAGEVSSAALLDIVQTVGGFLLGLILALVGLGGAAPLMGMGAISLLCLIFVLPTDLGRMRGGHFDRALARDYATYGVPVALSLILALVLATTDRFLLAAYLGEAAVGVYHAGYSLGSRTLDVVFIWLGMAGGPALVSALERGGAAALKDAAREQASFMVLLTLPAAVGLALVAEPLVELMVGESLRAGAIQVVPWIAASGWLAGVTTYYLLQAFTLGRRTPILIVAMAVPALANLVLNLVLIPRFGLNGALWATTASYGIGALAAWTLGQGAQPLPIPWRTLGKSGLGCVVMAVSVMAMPSPGGLQELILKAGVGAVVYGGIMLGLDVDGLRGKISGLIRRKARPA
ncbi:oligosaccharide flippase family protein [Caulobacter henricii]|uniref:Polysaccharide biosynthesis protein n=1 Tax=Caulobacter henricii TaxID=69395 RepID=A0A0P0NY53_9CAUL|nr:lipopolysaccharide biosynthesis protein [Caulobacter henricii]ALL13035.1 polysaccharide biosynthesis protein [Caulobacter henricii]